MNLEVHILTAKTDRASTLARVHGRVHTYVDHIALPHQPPSILMACRCPGGHGAAGLPAKFWLSRLEANLDLVREPAPAVTADAETTEPATSAIVDVQPLAA